MTNSLIRYIGHNQNFFDEFLGFSLRKEGYQVECHIPKNLEETQEFLARPDVDGVLIFDGFSQAQYNEIEANLLQLGAKISGIIFLCPRAEAIRIPDSSPLFWDVLDREELMVGTLKRSIEKVNLIRRHEAALLEEQRAFSEQYRNIQLGFTAAGLIHEINNIVGLMKAHVVKVAKLTKDQNNKELEEVSKKMEGAVGRIHKVIRHVYALLNQKPNGRFEKVSVRELIQDTFNLCRHRTEMEDIKLQVSDVADSLMIECHPVELCQVLTNLIMNSLNALGSIKGERWIRLGAQEEGEHVRFSVADSGKGLSSDVQKRMMDKFYTTRPGAGLGLGLHLVKLILNEHNGMLKYDETSPHTKFDFVLPLRQPEAKVVKPLSVLVLDDEVDFSRMVCEDFQEKGLFAAHARNLQEALAILKSQSIDFIICDINMPEMDGFELQARIRAEGFNGCFLFMTGYMTKYLPKLKTIEDDFVVFKPFNSFELTDRLLDLHKGKPTAPSNQAI